MAKRVFVGGGTGFVGRHLVSMLAAEGYDVGVITRTKSLSSKSIDWASLERNGLPECEAVVNLSGSLLMDPTKRWNADFEYQLRSSRLDTTKMLATAINQMSVPPKAFVTTSSIGYYKASDVEEYSEYSVIEPFDFSSTLCNDLEHVVKLDNDKTRHTIVRIGMVLGRDGGVVAYSYLPFFFGVGGPIGTGKHYFPWIHVDDAAGIIKHAIETPKVSGILNGVAPPNNTNVEYASALAKAMRRPSLLPVPKSILSLVFGSYRSTIMTTGSKIIPKRTLESGYKFQYPDLTSACAEIVKSRLPK